MRYWFEPLPKVIFQLIPLEIGGRYISHRKDQLVFKQSNWKDKSHGLVVKGETDNQEIESYSPGTEY